MNKHFLNRLALGLTCSAFVVTPLLIANPAFGDDEFAAKMDEYLANDENMAKLGTAIESYFMKKQEQQRAEQARQEERQMEEQFENPVAVELGGAPVLGKAEAPITIVEFSDFQCPYCARGAETMKEVFKLYPNDVKIAFKNLPLPFHPEAKGAAVAALAAHKQGKFWEMHDLLFANQGELGEDLYPKLAEQLELDLEKFKKDIQDPALLKQVEEDEALGQKVGVRGTPGFFVNGVQVKGARPAAYFQTLIDKWKTKLAEDAGK